MLLKENKKTSSVDYRTMIEGFFQEQQEIINDFFDELDLDTATEVFDLFLHCKGTIIFTGIGKSGFVAEKIAMTMLSTGTKALYLSPINALHGDLGLISADDIFVVFSKSGESEELLNLIPYVRNKGAFILGVTCNASSRLNKACDLAISLPLRKELCPFNLAPTTSAVIQLIFGDVFASALMKAKNYSIDQYALNHPSGRIGKRISLKVRDIMISGDEVPLCQSTDKLVDKLVDLSDKRCGCLIVVDAAKKMLGIFTDGDLRRALQNDSSTIFQKNIGDLMTEDPKWTEDKDLAWKALKFMEEDQKHPVMVLPVLDKEKKVIGILKMHDILQAGI